MRLLNEVLYIYHKNNIEYVLKKMANRKINHPYHHQQQAVRLDAKKTVAAMAYNDQQTKDQTTSTHTHHTAEDTNRNGSAATSAT